MRTGPGRAPASTPRPFWRLFLVILLVALPCALATGGLTVLATSRIDPAERARPLLGDAAALITEAFPTQVLQTPDGTHTLTTSTPATVTPGFTPEAPAARRASALAAITKGTVVPWSRASHRIQDGTREVAVGISVLPMPPTVGGQLTLVDGRWPTGPGEIAVQAGVFPDRWRTATLALADTKTPLRVVGTVSAARGLLASRELVSGDAALAADATTQYLVVRDTPLPWSEVRSLNTHGLAVLSAAVLNDPPPTADIPQALRAVAATSESDMLAALPWVPAAVAVSIAALAGIAYLVWRTRERGRSMPVPFAVLAAVLGVAAGGLAGVGGAWALARFGAGRLPLLAGPYDVPWLGVAAVLAAGFVGAVLAALWPRVVASGRWVVALLVLAIVGGAAGYGVLSARIEGSAAAARDAYVPLTSVGQSIVTWDPEGLTVDTVLRAIEDAAPGSRVIQTRIVPSGELFVGGAGIRRVPVAGVVPPGCTPEQTITDRTPVTTEVTSSPCRRVGSAGTLASSSILALPVDDIVSRFALTPEQADVVTAGGALVLAPGLLRDETVRIMTGVVTLDGTTGTLSAPKDVKTTDIPAVELAATPTREALSLRSGVVVSDAVAAELSLPTRVDALLVEPAAGSPAISESVLAKSLEAVAVGDGSILAQTELGYARSDRIVRFGALGAALAAILVLALSATALGLARRDLGGDPDGARRWWSMSRAATTAAVAATLGLGVATAYLLLRGGGLGSVPWVFWALVVLGPAALASVISGAIVRSR